MDYFTKMLVIALCPIWFILSLGILHFLANLFFYPHVFGEISNVAALHFIKKA